MKTIAVVIPAQKFNEYTYSSPTNCYLATAVKNMGYKTVLVGPVGRITIDGHNYIPSESTPFHFRLVESKFQMGADIHIKLIKQ